MDWAASDGTWRDGGAPRDRLSSGAGILALAPRSRSGPPRSMLPSCCCCCCCCASGSNLPVGSRLFIRFSCTPVHITVAKSRACRQPQHAPLPPVQLGRQFADKPALISLLPLSMTHPLSKLPPLGMEASLKVRPPPCAPITAPSLLLALNLVLHSLPGPTHICT